MYHWFISMLNVILIYKYRGPWPSLRQPSLTSGHPSYVATIILYCFYLGLKPIFHWKLGSRWVPNANEMDTNNMKCTWPTPAPCVGDPTQLIFHLLALEVCVGDNTSFRVCVGSARLFKHQHVGILLAKFVLWPWGLPNANPRGEPPTRGVLHYSGI